MLHHQGLPFMLKAIRIELISRHHNYPLAGYFDIIKTCELLAWKYYWPTLRHDIKAYVKGCDMCLASKTLRNKSYGNFQSLPVPTYQWKNLLIDFMTSLHISTNSIRNSYESIIVIVDRLTKMVHYKLVKITINTPVLVEVIIDMVIRHHGLQNSIVTDRSSFFISKFCSSLYYFLSI